MTRSMRLLTLLAGLPAILFTANVYAAVDEMIISSERREGVLQEVPLTVTAIGETQLEDLQVFEATDLQRYVPSLNMFNNITQPTNLSPSLRGGLQQDASLVTAESPFGIYVDDVYVGRLNGNNVRLSDIERVEVLRGPQGTLYGRNTAYGAIRFISRTPGDGNSWLDGSIGAGNDGQIRVNAGAGGPFNDLFAGSVAAQYTEKDGQFFNVATGQDIGEQENFTIRGKLRYTGSDAFDAILSVVHSDSENDSNQLPNGKTPGVPSNAQFTTDDLVWTNGEFGVNTVVPNPLLAPPPLGREPRGETQQSIAGLTLSYDINDDMELKSITGYVRIEDFFQTDFNGNSGAGTEFFAVNGASQIESDQISQEFQLLGNVGEQLNYIAGAYFLHEEAEQSFGWNLADDFLFVPLGPQVYLPLSQSMFETELDSIAFFGEASYQVTDGLKLTAGLRWTQDEKDFNGTFNGAPICMDPDPNDTDMNGISDTCELPPDQWDNGIKNQVLTPKFGIDYLIETDGGIIDSTLFYGLAAKGFKGGGYSAIAVAGTDAYSQYNPEKNWTYEAGVKADWFNRILRTNIALFFSEIEDIQQNVTTGTEFPVQNSGDAEIKGIEFEIVVSPIDGLNLFTSGSFLDGKYTRLEPGSAAANAPIDYGVTAIPPQTPDYAFTVGFDYTIDLPGDVFGDASIGLDYYETDEYITSATNDFLNSGWDQLNGFIALEFLDNYELRLSGKNLTDEYIVVSGSRALGGFVTLPPREWLLSLTYRM